jgi:hypothetical protein
VSRIWCSARDDRRYLNATAIPNAQAVGNIRADGTVEENQALVTFFLSTVVSGSLASAVLRLGHCSARFRFLQHVFRFEGPPDAERHDRSMKFKHERLRFLYDLAPSMSAEDMEHLRDELRRLYQPDNLDRSRR